MEPDQDRPVEPDDDSPIDPEEVDLSEFPPVAHPAPPIRPLRARRRRDREVQAPPWVADPKAREKAAQAAQAIGLTVEQLADLLIDNGLAALPPQERLNTTYTLEDLGKRLWATMQEYPRNQRQEWFASLNEIQRNAVLVTLKDRGFHFPVIAQEFGIDVRDVIQAWNKYCDRLGAQVVSTRLETIAGQLQVQASRAQHMAMEVGDHKGFWSISKDYVGLLQDLGVVDRAIHRVDHTHTHKFEDEQKREIEQLVELERKKERREAELKTIDAEVVKSDPLPMALPDSYDDEEQEKL